MPVVDPQAGVPGGAAMYIAEIRGQLTRGKAPEARL
jgi:hypothetical protein